MVMNYQKRNGEKKMKKILLLTVAMLVMLCLVACGGNECTEHVDEDLDGVCDVCEEAMPAGDNEGDNEGGDNGEHTVHTDANADGICDGCNSIFINYDDSNAVGKILKSSLEKQINAAKSVKIEIGVKYSYKADVWYEDATYDEYGDFVEFVPVNRVDDEKVDAKIVAVVSKNGDNIDAKIDATVDGVTETIYIIGGLQYSEVADGVYSYETAIPDEFTTVLGKVADIDFASKADADEILNAFGAEVATVFNIKDNKGSVSVDLKPTADSLLSYAASINPKTTKVSEIINKALSIIDEELTVDAILAELERMSALTTTEALAELDAWLTENYDTTAQQIYNTIVNDDDVIATIEAFMIATDLDKAEADQMIRSIKAFDIAAYLQQTEMGNTTLYDLVLSMMGAPEGAVPAAAELFKSVKDMLNMTVEKFEEATGVAIFSQIKGIGEYFSVGALNAKVDLNFKDVLVLDSVNAAFNIAYGTNAPSGYGEGKNNVTSLSLSVTAKIYDISDKAISIKLPSGTKTIDDELIDGYYYGEGEYDYVETNINFAQPYPNVKDPVLVNIYFEDENWGLKIQAQVPLAAFFEDVLVIEDYTVRASTKSGMGFGVVDGNISWGDVSDSTVPGDLVFDGTLNGGVGGSDGPIYTVVINANVIIENRTPIKIKLDPKTGTFTIVDFPEYTVNTTVSGGGSKEESKDNTDEKEDFNKDDYTFVESDKLDKNEK